MVGSVVENRDRCGRCGAIHGGNDHLCNVHGFVSQGCCEVSCDPRDWVAVAQHDRRFRLVPRAFIDLADYVEEEPYDFQRQALAEHGREYVHRYVLSPDVPDKSPNTSLYLYPEQKAWLRAQKGKIQATLQHLVNQEMEKETEKK